MELRLDKHLTCPHSTCSHFYKNFCKNFFGNKMVNCRKWEVDQSPHPVVARYSHSPFLFMGFRFPLHSQPPLPMFHDLFFHEMLRNKTSLRLREGFTKKKKLFFWIMSKLPRFFRCFLCFFVTWTLHESQKSFYKICFPPNHMFMWNCLDRILPNGIVWGASKFSCTVVFQSGCCQITCPTLRLDNNTITFKIKSFCVGDQKTE